MNPKLLTFLVAEMHSSLFFLQHLLFSIFIRLQKFAPNPTTLLFNMLLDQDRIPTFKTDINHELLVIAGLV